MPPARQRPQAIERWSNLPIPLVSWCMLMKYTILLLVGIGLGFVMAGGCSSSPGVATEEESRKGMEDTLSFDPMGGGSSNTPAKTSP